MIDRDREALDDVLFILSQGYAIALGLDPDYNDADDDEWTHYAVAIKGYDHVGRCYSAGHTWKSKAGEYDAACDEVAQFYCDAAEAILEAEGYPQAWLCSPSFWKSPPPWFSNLAKGRG